MSEEEGNASAGDEEAPKASVPWVPLILMLLVIPIVTIAVMQFVVVPKLASTLAATLPAQSSAEGAGGEAAVANGEPVIEEDTGSDGALLGPSGNRVVFDELVTNLANTKGSRFLRVSFEVIGKDKTLSGLVESKKSQVHDALITVLGNQTIEDIEGTGGRNKLRVALISALNTALGKGIAEELYFLDLIIQ